MALGRVIGKTQGFYDVKCGDKIYQLKLKGTLKKDNNKYNCVIGDIVEISEEQNTIISVYDRKNILDRPLISNIDYALIFWSLIDPPFDIISFQKNLLHFEMQNIKVILVINKIDLIIDYESKINELKNIFKLIDIYCISIKENIGTEKLIEYIKDKTVVLSGVSGVGKSSFINNILGEAVTQVGCISNKTKKGKNTTIVTKYYEKQNFRIFDTPGYSSVSIPKFNDDIEVMHWISEFKPYLNMCKFKDCIHINEPGCVIKQKVSQNEINIIRYDFYKSIIERKFDDKKN